MTLDTINATHSAADTTAPAADPSSADAAPPKSATSRRGLLGGAIGGAALAAGAATLASAPFASVPAAAATLTDADILNFALNLEYLEAEFYVRAAFGHGLPADDSTGMGTMGVTTGGYQVPFASAAVQQYAVEIAWDELHHVKFIRSALGSAAVARPTINLRSSFTALGRAAGFVGPVESFDPFSSDWAFLVGAYIFEDVGVTAYHGAAAGISNGAVLTAVAGILAVEAYHAAEIRLQLLQRDLASYTTKISALRARLSGAADDQGVIRGGVANIVPADANGLAYARTPAQVLNILYGGGTANNYLFFPNRTNGAIS